MAVRRANGAVVHEPHRQAAHLPRGGGGGRREGRPLMSAVRWSPAISQTIATPFSRPLGSRGGGGRRPVDLHGLGGLLVLPRPRVAPLRGSLLDPRDAIRPPPPPPPPPPPG